MPTTNLFDLSGRVAVITGGNGGIGRGIALGLAQAGAAIAVLARNEEKNQRVMSELQPLGEVSDIAGGSLAHSVRGTPVRTVRKVQMAAGDTSVGSTPTKAISTFPQALLGLTARNGE